MKFYPPGFDEFCLRVVGMVVIVQAIVMVWFECYVMPKRWSRVPEKREKQLTALMAARLCFLFNVVYFVALLVIFLKGR